MISISVVRYSRGDLVGAENFSKQTGGFSILQAPDLLVVPYMEIPASVFLIGDLQKLPQFNS